MAEPNGYIQGINGVPLELIDKTARAELPNKLTRPATAQVGDYLRIKAIGTDGTMEVEAVPAPTGGGSGSGENVNGGGLSAAAAELLIDLLRNALYPDDYDADGKIAELEVALGTGGDSGDETPDTGDADVTQSGSTLTISGVQDITTITQSGSVLALG